MTSTVNVPRELLENIVLCYNEGEFELGTLAAECHAILSAPSPAGVDGCKCSMSISMLGDGCRHCQPQEYIDRIGEMLDEERSELSDAQAIIDGLREDRDIHQRACIPAMEKRDQLAKCLKFARTTMSVVADNANLRGVEHRSLIAEVNRIDAALSAGKEGE